jgi:Putative auto-transporter adhesin, head GIN domain
MKKALTALASIALLAAPVALAESKAFEAKPFTRIDVDGAMFVTYKSGPETRVVVETSGGDFSDAQISNDGDTLMISRESLDSDGGWFSWNRSVSVSDDGKTIKVNGKKKPVYNVTVTGPDLEGVKASQSSRFTSQSISADSFDAGASSSAEMTLGGTAGLASLKASSSGEIDARTLKAAAVSIDASSSGEVDAQVTGTGESTLQASSSGDISLVSAAAGSFNAEASSGGSIGISGACKGIMAEASSGAEIDGNELRCATATGKASSGGEIDLFASESAKGSASSGGDVTFRGAPKSQDASKSSGGSVEFKS